MLLILPTGGAGALAEAEERGALRLETAPPAASLATGPLDATLDFNARPA